MAIKQELGQGTHAHDATEPTGGKDGSQTPQGSGLSASDMTVGLDGWRSMLMVPFRTLAFWFDCPAVEKIGKARVGDLAQPSFPLYQHYTSKWLATNPNDPLAVAKLTTLAVTVGVAMEVWRALEGRLKERQALQEQGKPDKTKVAPPKGHQTWQQSPIA